MKACTFTWLMKKWTYAPSDVYSLCRCRVNSFDALGFFLYNAFHGGFVKFYSERSPKCFRLIRCGKLVARSATYQGV